MSRLTQSIALATTALCLAASPVAASHHSGEDEAKPEMTKGEKELAKLLEGREAGKPVSCIRNFPIQQLRVINKTALVYGRGRTIYVQRTRNPQDIDDGEVLVTRHFGGSDLCRLDNVTTVDRHGGFFSGVIFFEDFVPYTKKEG